MLSTKIKVKEFLELESTNDYLKENYRKLDSFTVIKTQFQTNGRGQFNRVWNSMPNENLLFSLLLKDIPKEKIEKIRKWVILSLMTTLKNYKLDVRFKEPNDIYINDQKLCGVLIETKLNSGICEYIIIGIGLNINQTVFKDLEATSFKKTMNETYKVNSVFKKILAEMVKQYDT